MIKLQVRAGFTSQLTQTADNGGWFVGNLVRWRLGLLEKLAGWLRLIDTECNGYVRALHAWLDLSNNKNLLLGADGGPQIVVNDTLYDMQVIQSVSGTGSGASDVTFTTASGSATVTVTTSYPAQVGGSFLTAVPLSLGGIVIAATSTFTIATATTGSFTFTMGSNATATQTTVPGRASFSVNFATRVATVTFNNHGLSPGNLVVISSTTYIQSGSGNTAVYMSLIAGETITVVTAATANTFTFNANNNIVGENSTATAVVGLEGDNTVDGVVTLSRSVLVIFSPPPVVSAESQSWFVDNLGQNGLMVYSGSPVLVYTPPISNGAYLLTVGSATSPPTAPQINAGMFIAMPQAQVIVWGTEPVLGGVTTDPLLLRFSDVGTYDVWTATVSNQAGSYRLSRGSKIVGGIQAPQATLIWTDLDLWAMNYIGPPLVYGFTILAEGCGLASPKSRACIGSQTHWMGRDAFWMYNGSSVQPVPCPLWDYIFRDLDVENIGKCFSAASSSTNEVYHFFPSLTDKPASPTNWLQFTEELDTTGYWGRGGLSGVTVVTGPSTLSANKLVDDSAASGHFVYQNLNKVAVSVEYTCSIYAKGNSTRDLIIEVGSGANGALASFDVSTGLAFFAASTFGSGFAVVTSGSTTDSIATGLAGNGWLRYYLTFTTDTTTQVFSLFANADSSGFGFYTGNGTAGVSVAGAQLNIGTLLPYQEVVLATTNECTRYVKQNVAENLWDPGILTRTAWLDYNIFGTPLAGDGNFLIQQHEQGYDDDTVAMAGVYAETGYSALSDGDVIMAVSKCIPDMKWFGEAAGSVDIWLKTVNYPGDIDTEQEYGPYSVTNTTRFFSTRTRARQVAVRIEWAETLGFSARVGAIMFDVAPAGKRP